MIYTITLNPAIDLYMIVNSNLINGEVNRCNKEIIKAGGKGLNVSNILDILNIESTAIALIGGFSGQYIKECFESKKNINFVGIPVNGITRINAKIFGENQKICVNGSGSVANEETKEHIIKALDDIKENDLVMICGSNAYKGLDDEFIIALADFVNSKNARLIIDMESLSLEKLSRCKPYLIKPNLHELKILTKRNDISIENIKEVAKDLIYKGIENVLISLGKEGAFYINEKEAYKVNQPSVDAVNAVGCGDAMLATFVGSILTNMNIEDSLKYAVSAGIATACTIHDINKDMIDFYIKDLEVLKA